MKQPEWSVLNNQISNARNWGTGPGSVGKKREGQLFPRIRPRPSRFSSGITAILSRQTSFTLQNLLCPPSRGTRTYVSPTGTAGGRNLTRTWYPSPPASSHGHTVPSRRTVLACALIPRRWGGRLRLWSSLLNCFSDPQLTLLGLRVPGSNLMSPFVKFGWKGTVGTRRSLRGGTA